MIYHAIFKINVESVLPTNIDSKYVLKVHLTWYQEIAILIWIQFLNDIIKSSHGFKTTQKFHKFEVFIKTLEIFQML